MRLLFSVFSLHFLNCPYETVDFGSLFKCIYLVNLYYPAFWAFNVSELDAVKSII